MKLFLFVFLGFALAILLGIRHIERADWYLITISFLLAIGLYSSTYGIVLQESRKHLKIILSAVTVGVLIKALFIGSILTAIFHNPFFFLLGIMVSQIDPLSVSALMQGSRLSAKAKTILASWASFDDPVTVILCLYIPALLSYWTGTTWLSPAEIGSGNGLVGYFGELGSNIAYAAGVFVLWILLKQYARKALGWVVTLASIAIYTFLGTSLSIAAYYFWMLSVALIGLFLRPPIEELVEKTVVWALRIAAVLLGLLLVDGLNILYGVSLGIVAFAAQIFVGLLLTRGLNNQNRIHIAFAQQNGITAIILALLFEPLYMGTVAIIAPAILTVNIIHAVSNNLLDRFVFTQKRLK